MLCSVAAINCNVAVNHMHAQHMPAAGAVTHAAFGLPLQCGSVALCRQQSTVTSSITTSRHGKTTRSWRFQLERSSIRRQAPWLSEEIKLVVGRKVWQQRDRLLCSPVLRL
jgi:hypothetical protein